MLFNIGHINLFPIFIQKQDSFDVFVSITDGQSKVQYEHLVQREMMLFNAIPRTNINLNMFHMGYFLLLLRLWNESQYL